MLQNVLYFWLITKIFNLNYVIRSAFVNVFAAPYFNSKNKPMMQ